jgi:hypothetical protein
MLIEFRIKNFRSFCDTSRLSMVATTDKDLRDTHTISSVAFKHRLVRSAIIYGANASGKSNLIMALGFMQLFMLTAATSSPTAGQRAIENPLFQPFLLNAASRQAPTTFEFVFLQQNVRYEYGICLDRQQIYEEWLIAFPKGQPQTWFERRRNQAETEATADRYTWYFGPRLGGEKQRLADITRADVPFLAVAATFGHTQLQTVFEWFTNRLAVLNPSGRPDLFSETARHAAEDHRLQSLLRTLLANADLAINDFSVRIVSGIEDPLLARLPTEVQTMLTAGGFYRTEVRMRHQAPEIPEGYVEIPSDDESLGTQRFFGIAGPIMHALLHGQVLAVDEIDDSLHPLLVRRLIELFHNPETNPHAAQLIMNTHDATLLDTQLFRRDQIWFTEKDHRGGTQLYPLSDYRPRKGEALSKGYLHGRYGGVPILSHFGNQMRQLQETPATFEPSGKPAEQ